MSRSEVDFPNLPAARLVYGRSGENLKRIGGAFGVDVGAEGNRVVVSGPREGVGKAVRVVTALYDGVEGGAEVSLHDVDALIAIEAGDGAPEGRSGIAVTNDGRVIRAKTANQQAYVDAVRRDDVVFGIGPAGTGKTYLAMAMAVDSLVRRRVRRIVLVRPAVEAGERLGFLPGDMAEKVNPYLRPLYDALYDMVDADRAQHWISQGTIEVAPLAFMRGRTLNGCFVILDEAQNTTREQMKMFLTRLGHGSKSVITGDPTQTDLRDDETSGLSDAVRILDGVEGVSIVRLDGRDIVRHPLVQRIVSAYERAAHV